MSVFDINKYLHNTPVDGSYLIGKNRINRIGIELEGGWLKAPKLVERDSSVKGFPKDLSLTVGEIASPPIPMVVAESWIESNYPSHINKTCGLHVHMSFINALHYQRLMDSANYQDTIIEYLKRWAKAEGLPKDHCIWERLEGKSDYCQLKFWPDKQVAQMKKDYDRTKDGHRYTAVNYCHGLHNIRTLEVRVMPMLDTPQQAAKAVLYICAITNACLIMLARKEKPIIGEIDLPDAGKVYKDKQIATFR